MLSWDFFFVQITYKGGKAPAKGRPNPVTLEGPHCMITGASINAKPQNY